MKAFLIFSGTNDRAWTTLAHFFVANDVPFFIVARSRADICFQTGYCSHVILTRETQRIEKEDIEKIGLALRKRGVAHAVICPTSEYVNLFYFKNLHWFQRENMELATGSENSYSILTNKKRAYNHFEGGELRLAKEMSPNQLSFPCVAKPRKTFLNSKIVYPRFLRTPEDFAQLCSENDVKAYFFEEYLDGESYYLCLYRSADGRIAKYSQKNLAQQPEGKSIVAAIPDNLHKTPIGEYAVERIIASGFHGPAMVELYFFDGEWYFIEVNPRFWGPLRLSLFCEPQLIALFVEDWLGLSCVNYPASLPEYIWYKGANDYIGSLRLYGTVIDDVASYFGERKNADVYNQRHTQQLACKN